jgi:hypothetical protein
MSAWLPVAMLLLATQALGEGVPCSKFVLCEHSTGTAVLRYEEAGIKTVGVVEIAKDMVSQVLPLKGDKCSHLTLRTGNSVAVVGSAEEVKQRLGWAECD